MSPQAPLPSDESERLAALRHLRILDTPPEERFDRLTQFAKQKLQVPMVLISLVDENRQWFKSCQGLSTNETSRDVSFCAWVILNDEVLVVTDAKLDARFADNALVTGPPFIRFYAGYPLREPGGYKIGTLCIIDIVPRTLDQSQLQYLKRLAHMIEHQIYLHANDQP